MERSSNLSEIYERHWRFVWRSLRRLGVPEHATADAAQEVFIVVNRKLPTFEGRSEITTWLFGIAMRVAADARKRAHVRREVAVEGEWLDGHAAAHDTSDVVALRRDAEMLSRWLSELPIEQSATFTLFELDGMCGDDIAALMDVPVGTVRSRLRLAREAISNRLAELEVEK